MLTPYAEPEFCRCVQSLDPLHADTTVGHLPEMNRRADVAGMAEALRRLAPGEGVVAFDLPESLAAMRDLGMFLGSIRRHDVEPLTVLPEVQPALLALGAQTDMVPRDTIFHYTIWNPADERQRMYTGDGEEDHLQQSVRVVFPELPVALELCDTLTGLAPEDPRFAHALEELAVHVEPLAESMNYVRRNVSPTFFSLTLRPYLDPVVIDGTSYFGPAAAQLPLWVLDLALWGAGGDADYEAFWHGMVPYSVPEWRQLFRSLTESPSVVERVAAAVGRGHGVEDPGPAVARSAEACIRVLRVLVTFRARHLGIAKRAYECSSAYAVGSGGGSVELLREILSLTQRRTANS